MDIELLRTFLEVNRTGHFGKAAENLYLTQSAVSARIKQLEDILGVIVFERQRNNIRLTAAGQRFLRHAETIVGTWQRARQEAGLEDQKATLLSVAGLADLWEPDLLDWLVAIRNQAPDIALHASSQSAGTISKQVVNGMIDLAFVFEPQSLPEIKTRFVKRMDLVLVSTENQVQSIQALQGNYVMVDWGTAYAVTHAKLYPDAPSSALFMSHGSLAMNYILRNGGAAYLPESWCSGPVKQANRENDKQLYPVTDAVRIEREVHAIWRTDNPKNTVIKEVLDYFT